MNILWRAFVSPEIPEEELQHIFDNALHDAQGKPGQGVVIMFAPGDYLTPVLGALIYAREPMLHVRPPGAELTISWSNGAGKFHLDYKAVMWEGPAALCPERPACRRCGRGRAGP